MLHLMGCRGRADIKSIRLKFWALSQWDVAPNPSHETMCPCHLSFSPPRGKVGICQGRDWFMNEHQTEVSKFGPNTNYVRDCYLPKGNSDTLNVWANTKPRVPYKFENNMKILLFLFHIICSTHPWLDQFSTRLWLISSAQVI